MYYSLKILKIKDLCKYEIAKFIYKLKHTENFNYSHDLKQISQIHSHYTRNSKNNYFLQRKNTGLGKKTLEFIGTKTWQEVPYDIKEMNFLKFKRHLKLHLIKNYS